MTRLNTHIKTVVDTLAAYARPRVQSPLVVLVAIEVMIPIRPRASLRIQRHALSVGLNMRGESDTGLELAAHGVTLPFDVATGRIAGVVRLLLVLRVGAVGIVVDLGEEDTGLEFVAVAEVDDFTSCNEIW